MELVHGRHLAYCTNIHRGERWAEILSNLEEHTLAVRDRVGRQQPFAIGLRLGEAAMKDLSMPGEVSALHRWLDQHRCYVFTINGFPYGRFHGVRVKEQVYAPDWTTPERLEFTCRLFDLLSEILPPEIEGSVSTVPGSFKEFIRSEDQVQTMSLNLWRCVEHLARLRDRTGRVLHLDLEPEPLCFLETTEETISFFYRLRETFGDPKMLRDHLRVNYDACHQAVEFEEPNDSMSRLRAAGVRVGKLHLSAALKAHPRPEVRTALSAFADSVYLHQVVVRAPDGRLRRHRDLPDALATEPVLHAAANTEWRIHYHVPLHAAPVPLWSTTADHLLGLLDDLAANPDDIRHLEMETYTWDVLPPQLRARSVVEQLVAEYEWTLGRLAERGLGVRGRVDIEGHDGTVPPQ
jgi:hypothetical protein